jgi:hypothetical protein
MFAILIRLFRQCGLPIEATNSVAQFIQYIVRLLYNLISLICRPFLDNVAIKGPDIDYDNKEISYLPGIKRYIAEYIKNLDNILYNAELAGAAINAWKSE